MQCLAGNSKKGDVHRALIGRTRKGIRRPDGSTIQFDSNAVTKQNKPIGTGVLIRCRGKLGANGLKRESPCGRGDTND